MMALVITKHAALRMAQRGIPERDAELIALIGTEGDNGILVLSRDVHEWVHFLKRLIGRITRLDGKLLVTAQGTVVKIGLSYNSPATAQTSAQRV